MDTRQLILQIISIVLTSTLLASFFGWITTRKQQRNSFITELQKSIDLLSDKNEELMRKVVELREQNIELLANQEEMRQELEALRRLYEKDTGKPAPRTRRPVYTKRCPGFDDKLKELDKKNEN